MWYTSRTLGVNEMPTKLARTLSHTHSSILQMDHGSAFELIYMKEKEQTQAHPLLYNLNCVVESIQIKIFQNQNVFLA